MFGLKVKQTTPPQPLVFLSVIIVCATAAKTAVFIL